MTSSLAGQESLFAPDTWSGKTCPERSAATKDETSRPCSKRRSASSSRKPPVLKCLQKAGLPGGGYRDVDGRWSVAWRVHDAQYWGVPQRRRRIALVADFGGDTAHEILFERAGVSGDLKPRGEAGERPAGNAESGVNPAVARSLTVRAYGICSYASNSMLSGNPHSGIYEAETSRTLDLNGGNPACNQGGIAVVSYALQGSMIGRADKNGPQGDGVNEDVSFTLNTVDRHAVASCFDMTHACDVIRECGETVSSLQARMGTGGNQVPLTYGIGNGQANEAQGMVTERAQTLNTMHDAQAVMYVSPAHGALTVRRLTPLECERLQGFPDGWTDIGDYTDSTGKKRKTSDSARYKALGNSIALPFWRWMFGRMAAYLPEGATLGSLFDGIGGFPLCWEDVHGTGTAIWASEIEEFPIAVTKKRFGGENMIHYTLNIEPPVESPAYTCPRCPVCGEEADSYYKDKWGNIVGCPECVQEVTSWET